MDADPGDWFDQSRSRVKRQVVRNWHLMSLGIGVKFTAFFLVVERLSIIVVVSVADRLDGRRSVFRFSIRRVFRYIFSSVYILSSVIATQGRRRTQQYTVSERWSYDEKTDRDPIIRVSRRRAKRKACSYYLPRCLRHAPLKFNETQ